MRKSFEVGTGKYTIAMNVLITVLELETHSGLPLYTRDMAFELKRQGHNPEIYTLKMGEVARELIAAGIAVTDNPAQIKMRPDIIHGQHRVATLIAIHQFRSAPALFICHNHTFWGDQAPFHARLLLYLGVSVVCMERLRQDGVPDDQIRFSANFVDTKRFLPRASLPDAPRKALVFSNYATEYTHLPVVREACLQAGLELDVAGKRTNFTSNPENILANYEIVFAKAKAAIEAMAVGAAVILCDYSGIGPMVTSDDFERLRLMNFGFQSLTKPLKAEHILPEIARYDPVDAARVRDLARKQSNLEKVAQELVSLYESVIKQYRRSRRNPNLGRTSLRESIYWERARFWATSAPAISHKVFDLIAAIDPAAKEHTYMFTRSSILPGKSNHPFRDSLIALVSEIMTPVKFTPVRIWLTVPAPTRTRIKNLPVAKQLLKLLKRIILPD